MKETAGGTEIACLCGRAAGAAGKAEAVRKKEIGAGKAETVSGKAETISGNVELAAEKTAEERVDKVPVLEISNLTKTFELSSSSPERRTFTVVNNISFRVYRGETLGIVGGSGSGKSTLARLITRMIDADAGSVILDGQEITRLKKKELKTAYRNIQMVFQSPAGSFDPRKTIGNGIGESLINTGMPKAMVRKRVSELLKECGLPEEFADRYPHEISGGQCQRAAIARALAIEPKLLILDEATSALDVTVQKHIMELLSRLKSSKGLSYIFICHNIALVQSFCDRLIVMNDGCIVEEGTPEELIDSPRSEYTKTLIDAAI